LKGRIRLNDSFDGGGGLATSAAIPSESRVVKDNNEHANRNRTIPGRMLIALPLILTPLMTRKLLPIDNHKQFYVQGPLQNYVFPNWRNPS
jgi:hypothetical protein